MDASNPVRVVLLLYLIQAMDGVWIIEQGATSLMIEHVRLQAFRLVVSVFWPSLKIVLRSVSVLLQYASHV